MIEVTLSTIFEHNPWFGRPEFILDDTYIAEFEKQKYRYLHPLLKSFPTEEDAILTLRGPRRIGKSTLLKLLIRDLLLKRKINRENVFFFPCDRLGTYDDLYALISEYLNYIRPKSKQRIFIFLDEISFVRDWPRGIKELVDAGKLKNATLLLTGSSTLDLKYSSERLPGRRGKCMPADIEFLPLNFSDFVALVNPKICNLSLPEAMRYLSLYRKLFNDYLLTGGFPLTINQYFTKGYIPADIYESYLVWIEGDLHKVGKSEEVSYRLLSRIFECLATPVSYYKLTKEAAIASHATTEDYIDILNKMFILFKTEYFNLDQKKVDYKKNRKFYFYDPFIYFALKAKIDGFSHDAFNYSKHQITSGIKSALVENVTASHLKPFFPYLYYGRSGDKEIDLVGKSAGKLSHYEVKYQKRVRETDFIWFTHQKKKLTILTQNDFKKNLITLIPAEIFLARVSDFLLIPPTVSKLKTGKKDY
ncbi:MAG: ATP-binding protein [candidate division WOR-3 bacterium]